jgi:hypothetical protein
MKIFTGPAGTNWTGVFLVPVVLTVGCAAAFLIWFRPEKTDAPTPS